MSEDKLDLNDKLIAFKTIIKVIGAPIATVLTGDPFVGVGATNLFLESFFGIQSELKMKRVSSFIGKLEKGINAIDGELDLDKIDKIQFGDLLETAIIKSSRQRKEEKIEKFKNILIKQLIEPTDYDYATKFFELVEKLNEMQLSVLFEFINIDKKIDLDVIERKRLEKLTRIKWNDKYLETPLKGPNIHQKEIDQMHEISKGIHLSSFKKKQALKIFPLEERQFMQSELIFLGLVYNPAQGRASDTGEFHNFRSTSLASKFLGFIKSYK